MTYASVDYADLQRDVQALIKQQFPDGDIGDVRVREAEHEAGEIVLEIKVVFRGTIDNIAERAPLSLLRDLREVVDRYVERGFPFLNFVPSVEAAA